MSRAVNVVLYQGMFIYGRAFKVDYSVAKKKNNKNKNSVKSNS